MKMKIGIVAGKILDLFERYESYLSIEDIKLFIDEPDDIVLMSLGWLIRDGYLETDKTGHECIICSKSKTVSLSV